MNVDVALKDPLAKRVLGNALDRLDRSPPEGRVKAVRVPIDHDMAPEIYAADTSADREVAWHVLDVLAEAGIGTIEYRRAARYGSREDRQPVFQISTAPPNEELLRSFYGRPRPGIRYSDGWRTLAQSSQLDDDAKKVVGELPIVINGRSATEVFDRLLSIRDRPRDGRSLYLREVSSQAFWGLSKILDTRSDLVAALLGAEECPYSTQPIHLNIFFAGTFSWMLFIENKTSFERAMRDAEQALSTGQPTSYAGAALIYCSGFMGTAGRIRDVSGVRTFYCLSSVSRPGEIEAFETAFLTSADITAAFWGDLDYAGMAILASLRSSFPSATAWEPGYGPMLARLENGEGHAPEEARKTGQKPVASTGCPYADGILIPALDTVGRFVDQE
jgi:hypothetical protein